MIGDFATGCSSEVCGRPSQTVFRHSGMFPYAFFQCPGDPTSGPDKLLEGQPRCIFSRFSNPPSTGGKQTDYFVVSDRLS
ncbi:hypothetical protein AYI70_g4801 [Smittium culicis]|uniref:Uncharacterized protein n=1 Tax=Smittium culicis TaxID=133412 RepID=A0A1R1XXC9_9FUNG|nr:hypothetical protein AYI70_g4801 [Smittium culicis]